MELFKGYVPTKKKKCLIPFKDKPSSELKSYDEVKESGHLIKQGYQPRLAYLDVIDEFYLKEDTL